MFARTLRMQLKPESSTEFSNLIETQVIPLLRKQDGFQDDITFVRPGGTVAIRITLWENQEDADQYQRSVHPEVLKTLANVVEATAKARNFEVSNSTFHKIANR